MTQRFDWRDEEDPGLRLDPSQPRMAKRTAGRRRLVLITLALLVFLSLGVITVRELQQYLDQTNSRVREDLLAQNDLVLSAAENADKDILASLISERNPVWTKSQLDLVESGLMFDRRTFGMKIVEKSATVESMTISPELDNASIVVRFSYELDSGNSRDAIVGLLHELNYRRSNGRWLLSAPDDDYWKGSILDKGHYISIRYPERDYSYGKKLAVDLEALIAEFCSRYPSQYCAIKLPMQIELSANPKSIVQTELDISPSESRNPIELPTPSIFGIPEDEEGFRALYRAIGRHLVATIVISESGWTCCEQELLFQSLLDYQFVQFALESSTMPARSNPPVVDDSLLEFGGRIWTDYEKIESSELNEGVRKLAAETLVEYLLTNLVAEAHPSLQKNLTKADNFRDWLESSFGTIGTDNLVEDWRNYLYTQVESGE